MRLQEQPLELLLPALYDIIMVACSNRNTSQIDSGIWLSRRARYWVSPGVKVEQYQISGATEP